MLSPFASLSPFGHPRFVAAVGGGGFAPTDIGGLKVWYSHTGASAGTWPDISSSAMDATQGTAGQQAAIVSAALNGKQVRRFDGVDDLFTFSGLTLTAYTFFVVLNCTSAASRHTMLGGATGAPTFQVNGGGTLATEQGGQIGFVSASTNIAGAWHIAVADYAGGSQHIYVDGVLDGAGSGTGNGITGAFGSGSLDTIGTGPDGGGNRGVYPYLGDMAAVLIYDSVLGSTDRASVTSYLATQYGL